MPVENDQFLMWRSIDFVFASIDLVGRKSLGFSVSMDLDFAVVWVVEIDLISLRRIELDLILV